MRSARGFSMIELLVAVLVMGIGVLGITGLQMVSLQNNRGALVRAEAVQLAYDMLDRIRANPGANYGPLNLGARPGRCHQLPRRRLHAGADGHVRPSRVEVFARFVEHERQLRGTARRRDSADRRESAGSAERRRSDPRSMPGRES